MRTAILTTLLLLSVLAPMTTALADDPDPTDVAIGVANCLGVGPDGQPDRVRNAWVNVDVLYQSGHNCWA